jgi:hypothetical protein
VPGNRDAARMVRADDRVVPRIEADLTVLSAILLS